MISQLFHERTILIIQPYSEFGVGLRTGNLLDQEIIPVPVPVRPRSRSGPVDRDTADNLLTNYTQNRKI